MSIAKAGSLMRIESGEYSDFHVIGFFLVLREFDPMGEVKEYGEKHPEQVPRYKFRTSKFLAFLLAKGLLLEIEHSAFHFGDYSLNETSFYETAD